MVRRAGRSLAGEIVIGALLAGCGGDPPSFPGGAASTSGGSDTGAATTATSSGTTVQGSGSDTGDPTSEASGPTTRGDATTGGPATPCSGEFPICHSAGEALDLGLGPIWHLRLGDVDADGVLDLVTSHPDMAGIAVSLGDGAGGFANPMQVALEGIDVPRRFELLDHDHDGVLDLVTASGSGNAGLLAWYQGQNGTDVSFSSSLPGAFGVVVGMSLVNLDPDDLADLVIAGDGGQLRTFLATGLLQVSPSYEAMTGLQHVAMSAGDFTGDGVPDLVVASDDRVNPWISAGGGLLQPDSGIDASAVTASPLGDIDGDGNLDLAIIERSTEQVGVVFGTGAGFSEADPLYLPGAPSQVAGEIADLNLDGAGDIVVVSSTLGQVAVLRGGSFLEEEPVVFADLADGSDGVTIGDVDADAIDDVVVWASRSGQVQVIASAPAG